MLSGREFELVIGGAYRFASYLGGLGIFSDYPPITVGKVNLSFHLPEQKVRKIFKFAAFVNATLELLPKPSFTTGK